MVLIQIQHRGVISCTDLRIRSEVVPDLRTSEIDGMGKVVRHARLLDDQNHGLVSKALPGVLAQRKEVTLVRLWVRLLKHRKTQSSGLYGHYSDG